MTETMPFEFPGYQIQGLIGRGGMGRVYRAEQTATRRPVAIKILTAGTVGATRLADFRREASTLARLEHPHIVPLYDYGELEGSPYLVVRYFGGGTVADRLEAGPIDMGTALTWIDDVAAALDAAHGRGITHRDVKPSNLLLDDAGHIYLGDFGIAAAAIDLAAAPHSGSAAYASPEQARGQPAEARSDVYSLAVTAFEMLTGAKPYEAETALGMMVRHMHDPVPSARAIAPSLPAGLDAAIAAGMAKAPGDRPASAGAFARSLRTGLASGPGRETLAPRPAGARRRSPSLGLLIGLSLLAGVACLAVVGVFGGGLAVYFATSATSTPSPTQTVVVSESAVPTLSGTGRTLPFSDDFTDPASGFGVKQDADGEVTYVDGGLRFTIVTAGIEWFSPLPDLTEQDVTIQVNAQQLEGPPGSEMGVVCRWHDEDNYVAAALRHDGHVSLWELASGVEDRWLDWTPIAGFEADSGAVRALRLTCAGSEVRLAVDGVEVASASDALPTTGSMALMAGLLEPGSLTVAFDQLEVSRP